MQSIVIVIFLVQATRIVLQLLGRSQLVHILSFQLSIHQISHQHCFISEQPAVLCKLTLATGAAALSVCTDIRGVRTSAASSQLDL